MREIWWARCQNDMIYKLIYALVELHFTESFKITNKIYNYSNKNNVRMRCNCIKKMLLIDKN